MVRGGRRYMNQRRRKWSAGRSWNIGNQKAVQVKNAASPARYHHFAIQNQGRPAAIRRPQFEGYSGRNIDLQCCRAESVNPAGLDDVATGDFDRCLEACAQIVYGEIQSILEGGIAGWGRRVGKRQDRGFGLYCEAVAPGILSATHITVEADVERHLNRWLWR